ncbi:hypothetical protein COO60DRAFT_1538035 [Scenedesmus sp. NREL 46B-D3]|nr:hypothetical protein COO60DRAFT_1538035 [Scenedesmus sp. NREL 46B-D3]
MPAQADVRRVTVICVCLVQLAAMGPVACSLRVSLQVLQDLGLQDIYGAWNEVLWALNVSDGLQPRAFTARVVWGERASLIVQGAVRFGMWAGRDKVATEDLLMAFAASDVLSALFPDVDLSFDRVKHAIEKRTGVKYDLPGYEGAALDSQDMFL